MGDHTDTFMRKLQEYDKLIRFAARRLHISGVLDQEDLYQEGLLILNSMLQEEYLYYPVDPDSIDFRKLFKTELWHGLINVLQAYKARKRDWKKKVNKDYSQLERMASRSNKYGSPYDDHVGVQFGLPSGDTSYQLGPTNRALSNTLNGEVFSTLIGPEDVVSHYEDMQRVDKFITTLINRLDDEAQIVLMELLFPIAWDDIPEEFRVNGQGDKLWRQPRKGVPQHVLARILDWPLIRVRRAVKRIRRHSAELGSEMGFDLLAGAGKKKRRRRKN